MEKENLIYSLEQICLAADITIKMLDESDEGIVKGNVQFRKENVLVKFDTEKDTPLMADFDILIQQLKRFISHFKENNYEIFIHNVSHQVISNIYEQFDKTEQELKKECIIFQKNMTLKSIEIFPDGFMLVYDIKFDNELLYLQLDTTYSIEDITIN